MQNKFVYTSGNRIFPVSSWPFDVLLMSSTIKFHSQNYSKGWTTITPMESWLVIALPILLNNTIIYKNKFTLTTLGKFWWIFSFYTFWNLRKDLFVFMNCPWNTSHSVYIKWKLCKIGNVPTWADVCVCVCGLSFILPWHNIKHPVVGSHMPIVINNPSWRYVYVCVWQCVSLSEWVLYIFVTGLNLLRYLRHFRSKSKKGWNAKARQCVAKNK